MLTPTQVDTQCAIECGTTPIPTTVDPTLTERQTRCPTATVTSANYSFINDPKNNWDCCEDNGDGSTKLRKCTDADSVTASWMPCNPPYWWEINSFWMCWCPDGKKDVDWTCKLCSEKWVCCGVELNTAVPFIGKCIESDTGTGYKSSDETWVTSAKAFPVLMWSLTKILVTLILITSFVLIIIGGIMIATWDLPWGKKMIINVVIGIALLGASWVILRLINPNFFG